MAALSQGFAPMATQLETERLYLRLWQASDTAWHHALTAERDAPPITADDDQGIVDRVASGWAETGIGLFAIERVADGDIIGYCGLILGRSTLDEPELAYELFRRVHGNGYATEAARVVVAAAVATGRSRLWATIRSWNTPSFRVAEKVGFIRNHTTSDEKGELVWCRLELSEAAR